MEEPHAVNRYWQERVKGLLKAELERGALDTVNWPKNSRLLAFQRQNGTSPTRLRARGSTAVFFVQCLEAIGASEVRLQ